MKLTNGLFSSLLIGIATWAIVRVVLKLVNKAVETREMGSVPGTAMRFQDAEKFVRQLEDLGYYRYTAPENIPELRGALIGGLQSGQFAISYWEDKPFSKEYRYFLLDGEDLFEAGGVPETLEQIEPIFVKMGVKMNVTNYREDYPSEDEGWHQEITLNNKQYVLFHHFKGNGWGEAAQRFADIVNDQLSLQHVDERLYLINGGNDGSAVFLTGQQFALIDKAFRDVDDSYRPLTIDKWCKLFDVVPGGSLRCAN